MASAYAGRLALSGPAAGVVAATALGRAKGYQSIISFDMGGTSTDVCRVDSSAIQVSGHSRAGGSIECRRSRCEQSGPAVGVWPGLTMGVRFGWDRPRPVPTRAGRIWARWCGGHCDRRERRARAHSRRYPPRRIGSTRHRGDRRRALGLLGADLGIGVEEVAAGIIEVVDTHMERALRAVSVEEGVDTRNSVLVAFGGAGGLHATRLARRLGMRRTLIPPLSGVFSALGLLLASPGSDASRTVMLDEGSTRLALVTEEILDEASGTYRSDHGSGPLSRKAWAEVRYAGQSHELPVSLVPDWARLASGVRGRAPGPVRIHSGW